MANAIPKFDETEVEAEIEKLKSLITDFEKRPPLEQYQIDEAVKDCAYWVVIVDTLQRDVLENGVLQNRTKGAKDNRSRIQVERETLALLHKVQPRKRETFKVLDDLCARGAVDNKEEEENPFISFVTN